LNNIGSRRSTDDSREGVSRGCRRQCEPRSWIWSALILAVDNVVARIWKDDLPTLNSRAAIANVAGEHVWKLIQGDLSLVGSSSVALDWIALHADSCAVLIHLPIPNQVEPRPGEEHGVRRGCEARDREVVSCRERTSANHRFNDFEGSSIVV
jgi:hypothetical protein